jgi:uncharacterized protein DUF3617
MNMRFSSALLLVVGLSWSVMAQGASPMREGNWEVAMKINFPGMEGAPPIKQTQCVTAAMLKDPQSAIPKGPDGGDCKVTDYKLADGVATYKLTCTQPFPLNATGELKYAGTDAYTGTLTMDMGGQNLVTNIDAKRIGDCAK